jgi:hypothetical protein
MRVMEVGCFGLGEKSSAWRTGSAACSVWFAGCLGESRWIVEVIWDVGRTIVKDDWIPEEIGVEAWDGEGKRMELVRGEKI